MNTHVVTKFDGKMAMILKGHPDYIRNIIPFGIIYKSRF